MTLGRRILVLALAWSAGVAGVAPAARLDARVRALVAQRWEVAEDAVEVAWADPDAAALPAPADLVLAGTGADGRWTLRSSDAAVASVRIRAGVRVATRVAARPIARGRTLTAEDIADSVATRWGPPAAPAPAAEPGWEARRAVRAGEPLVPPAVSEPKVVAAGATVALVWSGARVRVSTPGRALASAALGDTVAVRAASGTRLIGVVTAPGVVSLVPGSPR